MSALALGLCGGCLVAACSSRPICAAAPRNRSATSCAPLRRQAISGLCGMIVAAALFPMLVAQLSLAGMIGGWTLSIGKDGIHDRRGDPDASAAAARRDARRDSSPACCSSSCSSSLWWLRPSGCRRLRPATRFRSPATSTAAASLEDRRSRGRAIASAAFAWNLAGLGLCVTLGVAVFPALLIRSAAAHSTQSSRSSLAWTLFLLALFAVASACAGGGGEMDRHGQPRTNQARSPS